MSWPADRPYVLELSPFSMKPIKHTKIPLNVATISSKEISVFAGNSNFSNFTVHNKCLPPILQCCIDFNYCNYSGHLEVQVVNRILQINGPTLMDKHANVTIVSACNILTKNIRTLRVQEAIPSNYF